MNKDKQLSSIVSRFFIAAIAGLHCAAACSFAADKPNVIFILADDLGYGDVPAFNPESKIPMPNIPSGHGVGKHDRRRGGIE